MGIMCVSVISRNKKFSCKCPPRLPSIRRQPILISSFSPFSSFYGTAMTTNPKALRNAFISLLKSLIEEDLSTDIVVNTCRNDVSFSLAGGQQEVLGLRCLTGTHVPIGALFAITFHVHVGGGTIYEILRSLLPKESFCTSLYAEHSSNLTKYAVFRNHGVVCFYAHDNLAAFTRKLYPTLQKEFIVPAFALLQEKKEVIDHIVAKAKSYSFPLATILILLSRLGELEHYESLLSSYTNFRPADRKIVLTHDFGLRLKQLET